MDFTPLANAIISLVTVVIATFLVPYIKAKIRAEKYKKVQNIVRVSVRAAEQFYGAGKGDEKLKYVEQRLLEQGIKIDLADIKDMIEAEVYKLTEPVEVAAAPIPKFNLCKEESGALVGFKTE